MVSFRDGVPDKNNYRRYRIRTVEGQDDFASMAEVVRRRYARVLLQARAENPEAAEFSQENPVEAVNRASATTTLSSPSSRTERSGVAGSREVTCTLAGSLDSGSG